MKNEDNDPKDDSSQNDESYYFGSLKKITYETVEVSAQWNTDYLIAAT